MTPTVTRPVSDSIIIISRSYLSSLAVNRNVFFCLASKDLSYLARGLSLAVAQQYSDYMYSHHI